MKKKKTVRYLSLLLCIIIVSISMYGCDNKEKIEHEGPPRDSTSQVLIPKASGDIVKEVTNAKIDASNISEGYVMAQYRGNKSKVKIQITGPDNNMYQYSLNGGEEFFPLSSGNGNYKLIILENIEGTSYGVILDYEISVTMEDEFLPYLYANQYINFNENTLVVKKAKSLAENTYTDIEVVGKVYDYVLDSIEYDYDKASNVQSGYLPDIDKIIASKKGICFDYTAVMVAMLRSQRIPTILKVGWSGDIYHAWISVYVDKEGWVNDYIYFDGDKWNRMDPTFADSNDESKSIIEYIKDDLNYEELYRY